MTRTQIGFALALLVSGMFGVLATRAAAQPAPSGAPERRALQDGKQVVDIDCPDCKGSGKARVPESQETCTRCNGEGWYPPGIGHFRERCGQDKFAKSFGDKGCGGTGKITKPAHDDPCPACGGRGKVKKTVDNPLIKRSQQNTASKALTFDDLPALDWSTGFYGDNKLRWGMSEREVAEALGAALHLESDSSGVSTYSAKLTTTWEGKQVGLDHWSISFARGRFYEITLEAAGGSEDSLLAAAFSRFGAARFAKERLEGRSSEGQLFHSPKPRAEGANVPADQNPPEHWYQWVDDQTEVFAWDFYGYSSSHRRNERGVLLTLRGWRVAVANAPSDFGPRYATSAACYLDWVSANGMGR